MSTSHPSQSYRCSYRTCETTFDAGTAIAGSYCSWPCYWRHEGQTVLNIIQHNHLYCSNCGAELKEIEPPTDEQLRHISGYYSTLSVVGYQYRTPHAETGEITVRDEPGKRVVTTGTTCARCGNANPTAEFPECHELHPVRYGRSLLDALLAEREQGTPVPDLDHDLFFATARATGDVRLALGRARDDTDEPPAPPDSLPPATVDADVDTDVDVTVDEPL